MRNLTVMFVTAVCFLFLLKMKWPKNKNIYEVFTCTPTQLGSITSRCSRKEPVLLYRTHFSLLTSHFALLTSHFSLLTSHFPLLTSHFSLLTSHFSLLTSHFSGRNLVKPNSSKRRKSSRSTTVSMIVNF